MSEETRPRLLLIDGHSMAFRAFYALPVENFATTGGQPTNAVFGFTSMLLNLLRDEAPTHVGVAFDVSRITFRTARYPEYKATRSETPEAFAGQISLIKEVLAAMGIAYLEKDDFEADDIIATLSTRGAADGMDVLVCSGDRDSLQLVSDAVTVLYPVRGVSELARMTPEAVEAKYGVPPRLYPDLAAMVGEKSDNLPGVDKVGQKTAAKWLTQYGDLAGVLGNAETITGRAGENLRAAADQVRLNRELGELVRDLSLPLGPDDLRLAGWRRDDINDVFAALQFTTLRQRLFEILPGEDSPAEAAAGAAVVSLPDGGLAPFLDSLAADRVGLDVAGQVAHGVGDAWRVAVAGPGGDAVRLELSDLDEEDSTALAAWLVDSGRSKAIHDWKTAWHALRGAGYVLGPVDFDTSLADYLVSPEQRRHELPDVSVRVLGLAIAEPDDGQGLLDLDESADTSGAERALATLKVADALEATLEARGGVALLSDVEQPLAGVLARMEAAGIAADLTVLGRLDEEFAAASAAAAAAAYAAIGHEVNLGSPKQLQEVLFDELGMPKTKKTKTGYTTDADALAELHAKTGHPFLEHLLVHRDQIKLRQTVQGLLKSVSDDGRIHTTFQQNVAATGRLSSADPNLQNIPNRTDVGRQIRAGFTVGQGYETLLTADYSQIEMRIMAHLSGDEALIEAFRSGEDLHSFVASRVFGVAPGDVTSAMRSRIKAMSYGLAYGLSAYGLSRQLGVSTSEAQTLMGDYFDRFGGIRDYLRGVVEQARKDGYTETIFGRRRYLPDLSSDNRQRRELAERAALNAPIQGSAADIIKIAMIDAEKALAADGLASRLLLQVHDELVVEVAPGEAEAARKILIRCMGGAADLRVPLDVSTGEGHSWDAAGH